MMGVDLWEARYRELERQIEFMMRQVATEWAQSITGNQSVVNVRKLFMDSVQRRLIVCVADGVNLDYEFIVEAHGHPPTSNGFTRSNSYRLPEEAHAGVITVNVRSHATGEVVSANLPFGADQ